MPSSPPLLCPSVSSPEFPFICTLVSIIYTYTKQLSRSPKPLRTHEHNYGPSGKDDRVVAVAQVNLYAPCCVRCLRETDERPFVHGHPLLTNLRSTDGKYYGIV